MATRKRPTKQAEKERRRAERAELVEQLRAQLAAQVEQLVTSGGWTRMLAAARSLHRYSLRNQLLIWAQAAERGFDPTDVDGYKAWQARGRHVRKGQRGLRILAPCLVWVDLDADDEPTNVVRIVETPTGRRAQLRRFRPTSVWDISQTDGPHDTPADAPEVDEPAQQAEQDSEAALAELGERLDDLAAFREQLAGQVEAAGYTLRYGPTGTAGVLGVTIDDDRSVIVSDALDITDQLRVLAHELAHITLGHEDHDAHDRQGRREVEAESVAYIVLGAHGIDIEASASYVTDYAEGDVAEVLAAAERVTEAARQILDRGDVDEDDDHADQADEGDASVRSDAAGVAA